MCIYVYLCWDMCTWTQCIWRQKEALDPLVVVNYPTWVLGNELRSSARVVCTIKPWTISPDTNKVHFEYVYRTSSIVELLTHFTIWNLTNCFANVSGKLSLQLYFSGGFSELLEYWNSLLKWCSPLCHMFFLKTWRAFAERRDGSTSAFLHPFYSSTPFKSQLDTLLLWS